MQSNLPKHPDLHVAIIMDGNGRWATRRCLPRTAGHRAGVAAVRRVSEAAPALGIATLTLFAFSTDNWRRPPEEVDALMWLMQAYLRAETRRFVDQGARLSVIGRRDRLPPRLVAEIEKAEAASSDGRRLHLRIALDYSGRAAILDAARRCIAGLTPSLAAFGRMVAQADAATARSDAVDLLIRTGGEKRLSDFLLWESAYAELWFTDTMWPEFSASELSQALAEFRGRERRFGRLPALAAAQPAAATR